VVTGVGRVSDRTRAHVEDAIAEIGYRPDVHARSLAGGPTGVVGVLTEGLCSSYITEILRHFDAALAVHGLQLMLCSTRHRGPVAQYVADISSGVVDGLLILCSTGLASYLDDLQQRRFPHVLIDVEDDPGVSPVISFDNEGGISAAVHHLLWLGHRRFGFVTGDLRSAAARERLDAFMRTLQAAGTAAADHLVVEGDWCEQSGYTAGIRLLSSPRRPTAIVVSNDLEGLGVLRAARERGIEVPADLSIVGCDDVPEATAVHPSLTTVRQPLSEIGRAAARLLHEQITRPGTTTHGTRVGAQLVVRETTAAAPA
jgi:LacI family transcriptional regulator